MAEATVVSLKMNRAAEAVLLDALARVRAGAVSDISVILVEGDGVTFEVSGGAKYHLMNSGAWRLACYLGSVCDHDHD